MSKFGKSSFWLGNWADDSIVTSTMSQKEKKSHDLYKLASTRRAISNFVSIVTNQSIPVIYRTNGDSYTDGKKVVIGTNVLKPKDFDVYVGLALHEGSHIILSDFDLLRNLDSLIDESTYLRAEEKGISRSEVRMYVKDLWNYVEDRRIDNYIYKTAPGYRGYYKAMYDKYFNDHIISKALRGNEMTDETLESYRFRIINLHSDDARLDALNGLREIYDTADLPNIGRLKNSQQAFDTAVELFEIILKNIDDIQSQESNSDESGDSSSEAESGNEQESSEGTESDDNSEDEGNDSNGSDDSSDTQGGEDEEDGSEADSDGSDEDSEDESGKGSNSKMTGEETDEESSQDSPSNDSEMDSEGEDGESSNESSSSQSSSSNGDGSSDVPELTERQKKLLPKRIERQRSFLEGDNQKTAISESESKELEQIEESGSEIKTVGEDVNNDNHWYNSRNYNGVECIVVKKMTKSLMSSKLFPMASTSYGSDELVERNTEEVQKGIRLGSMLGKKLQVRGEERNTVYTRQKSGKIDKRMVASLGFGNESVFQTIETDSYKNANLHVSIDASGSMGGSKWSETITNIVALCKAVDMISNLDIQVTFRTTSINTNGRGDNEKPYIVKAYDSREDKFIKVKNLFPYLHVAGTTPEGLCFEAIMDEFMPVSHDWDSYFLNVSDGMPYFSGSDYYYSDSPAYEHTKKMVRNIEKMGIKVLSYYVESSYGRGDGTQPSPEFKEMYGKAAVRINVTNVSQISKTMNKLFLTK